MRDEKSESFPQDNIPIFCPLVLCYALKKGIK